MRRYVNLTLLSLSLNAFFVAPSFAIVNTTYTDQIANQTMASQLAEAQKTNALLASMQDNLNQQLQLQKDQLQTLKYAMSLLQQYVAVAAKNQITH